jgi:hypothetical protein
MKIRALEQAMEKLVSTQATNIREIKRAFAMADQHTFVLQRICTDIVRGNIRMVPVAEEDQSYLSSNPPWEEERNRCFYKTIGCSVDLAWYHFQYYQAMQLQGFIEVLQSLKYDDQEKNSDQEKVSYFGGDYGEDQPPQG